MKAERKLLTIIRRFGLDRHDVREIRTVKRGVYRVTTRSGEPHCLKRMRYSEQRLAWMDRTVQALRENGFHELAWRDAKSRLGKRLHVRVDRSDHPYILTPWLEGRPPDGNSARDMQTIAAALARFHETSRKIDVSTEGLDNWLGTWPQRLEGRACVLKKQIARAKRRHRAREKLTAMEQVLVRDGESLLRRVEGAMTLLYRSDYRSLCKRASKRLTIVHGDSGPRNFVITAQGPALIDFETLRVDLRVFDLYRMIRLASKENGWNLEVAQAVLDGYRSVSELHACEYELLQVWLLFPQKAYRMLCRYKRVHDEERRQKVARELHRSLEEDRRLPEFLQGLQDYASRE